MIYEFSKFKEQKIGADCRVTTENKYLHVLEFQRIKKISRVGVGF